jgi:hypothetical protein
MSTQPIDYLVHFYFAIDGIQYRGVSARSAANASHYDSYIEALTSYSPALQSIWAVLEGSRLEHGSKWCAEDRAHLLTNRPFNKNFIAEEPAK